MLIAASTNNDGRKVLYLGLQEENIQMLKDDHPIYKDLSRAPQNVPGLEEWDVVIMGPEDTARFIARVGVDHGT